MLLFWTNQISFIKKNILSEAQQCLRVTAYIEWESWNSKKGSYMLKNYGKSLPAVTDWSLFLSRLSLTENECVDKHESILQASLVGSSFSSYQKTPYWFKFYCFNCWERLDSKTHYTSWQKAFILQSEPFLQQFEIPSIYSNCSDKIGWSIRLTRNIFFIKLVPFFCTFLQTYGIIESLRLEKTSKIIKPNCQPTTTAPTRPCPVVPHLHVFWIHSGMVTPPLPWATYSNAWPLFQ